MAQVTHGAQPRVDLPALPSGDDHRWLVIHRGVVQLETITASSHYLAQERACARHQCERAHVTVALIPKGLVLVSAARIKKGVSEAMRKRRQCPNTYTGTSGSTVFCLKKIEHKGDHRGRGAQWGKRGKREYVTEPLP